MVDDRSLDRLLALPISTLVVGFGVANRAVAAALVRRGHTVVAVDDRAGDEVRDAAAALGIELIGQPDDLHALVAASTLVVPTPGLPEWHPVFAIADELGVPVISELDLAAVWDDRPVIAITGTNGKTTAVELAVAALGADGQAAVAAGNTDIPLVTAIDDADTDVFVVEASSFRLARASRFSPLVSTWLNFAPDHLDVHHDLESYEAAKARIFTLVAAGGTIVANVDDPVVMRNVAADASLITFGSTGSYRSVDGELIGPDGMFGKVADLWRDLPHDVEDTLAVVASLVPLGVAPAVTVRAAATFSALAHRVSPVGELDGQMYFDDSKATTPHATLAAVRGFERVVLIAGGRNKGIDLSVMGQAGPHVDAVVAIGDAADEIETAFAGIATVARAEDMEAAVDAARTLSAGRVPVLLSPGCASFDWYRSYGERGDDFARIVESRAQGERS
ncbi:MAG: UDP-N-acetylmuramoyl-L-alanine--D-glutamate ligase [Actinomycetota bacterium]